MLKSLELGGDGDEVDAIEDIEEEFDVVLDKNDALNWFTVGDVYRSLLKAMPPNAGEDPSVWKRFCVAICQQTGVDSGLVGEETALLAPPLVEQLKGWLKRKRAGESSGESTSVTQA